MGTTDAVTQWYEIVYRVIGVLSLLTLVAITVNGWLYVRRHRVDETDQAGV